MASITNVLRVLMIISPLVVSILLILFAALDIVYDIQTATSYSHILLETFIFFLGFLLNLFFVHRTVYSLRNLQDTNEIIHQELKTSVEENEHLKLEQQKLKQGLYEAIEKQLHNWGLSPSEIEISFLLLKGLSNKEIAEVRKTSESTVRLQCSSLYKKANLGSRSELAAYFLEDLLIR